MRGRMRQGISRDEKNNKRQKKDIELETVWRGGRVDGSGVETRGKEETDGR